MNSFDGITANSQRGRGNGRYDHYEADGTYRSCPLGTVKVEPSDLAWKA